MTETTQTAESMDVLTKARRVVLHAILDARDARPRTTETWDAEQAIRAQLAAFDAQHPDVADEQKRRKAATDQGLCRHCGSACYSDCRA